MINLLKIKINSTLLLAIATAVLCNLAIFVICYTNLLIDYINVHCTS